ncbi:MAG TPA: YebC/PmpR family DNA-binding transcriptional regulator [Candidatus Saccharibacteria bacterium]|nr:YebC/PmpR family DNA-binding transcriptional regulator [Candidatus Saccharibacteria bacterium]HMT39683.1 YebC/PmpR family DNA-binding transcriptional regulator [Candidatus Saccharibacteria bacterium]
MSGHSKWHSIKHKKGAADAKRGKIFTKLGHEIAIAARDGADPSMNFKLRLAVQKAKAANMPAANIERSIARGAGTGESAALEELNYEGYGPAGVAIMARALTDNRNRTGPEIKSTFTKFGGNLGATGSVAYLFEQKGIIVCKPGIDKDEVTLKAIDAGAADIDDSGDQVIVYTKPNELEQIREKLGEDVESADVEMSPSQTISVDDVKKAQTLIKLIDALDDIDDVVSVTANYDISDEIMSQLS